MYACTERPVAFMGFIHPIFSPSRRRYRVYRPIRRSLVGDACGQARVKGRMVRLKHALFPSSEESCHLLTERQSL